MRTNLLFAAMLLILFLASCSQSATSATPAQADTPAVAPTDAATSQVSAGISSVIGTQPVVGWLGLVFRLPSGSRFDDYLSLQPEGIGEVGLTSATESVEAEIESLRDSGRYGHFWGTLACNVADYGGCQVLVTRVRPEGPGEFCGTDPVEGWEGTIVSTRPTPEYEDYFVLTGDFPMRYGIGTIDPTVAVQLESLLDTQTTVRVWGRVVCGVPDVNDMEIEVTRIEIKP